MEAYKKAWRWAVDDVTNAYVAKFRKYWESYIDSPAGRQFKEDSAMARAHKKTIPGFSIRFLSNYRGKDGIKWGTEQILDIFERLGEVSHLREYSEVFIPRLIRVLMFTARIDRGLVRMRCEGDHTASHQYLVAPSHIRCKFSDGAACPNPMWIFH